MNVPLWIWGLTVAAIIGMIAFDFLGHVRTPHAPTLRESSHASAARRRARRAVHVAVHPNRR